MQRFDALAIGETMVMVTPIEAGGLGSESLFRLRPGGAEANVALHLARLRHSSAWASAVGEDPFGGLILQYLIDAGVYVDCVERSETAPTGVYFKHVDNGATRVQYYRAGSAASKLDGGFLDRLAHISARVVHASGITPSLSPSCLSLTRRLLHERPLTAELVSFDVNYRPALWPVGVAAPELLSLASAADIVFVGLDEARVLWGTTSPQDVRDLLGHVPTLIVKDHAHGATVFDAEGSLTVAPAPVEVVEVVGAGDAFAAGWLSGMLRGHGRREQLELGHRIAALVLGTTADDVEIPLHLQYRVPELHG